METSRTNDPSIYGEYGLYIVAKKFYDIDPDLRHLQHARGDVPPYFLSKNCLVLDFVILIF